MGCECGVPGYRLLGFPVLCDQDHHTGAGGRYTHVDDLVRLLGRFVELPEPLDACGEQGVLVHDGDHELHGEWPYERFELQVHRDGHQRRW